MTDAHTTPETLITAQDTPESGADQTDQTAASSDAGGQDSQTGQDTSTAQAGDDSQAGDAGEDALTGAPEAYDDFAMPDGVELNTEVLADFKAVAKELNLPQAAAQKVADLGAKLAQSWATQFAEGVIAETQAWAEASRADPEIGGAKLQETISLAQGALKLFGTPELAALMNERGIGNHPEVLRAFAKIGKQITEDKIVTGQHSGQRNEGDTAKRLYPTMA